jgi:probable rRNA maturation factor
MAKPVGVKQTRGKPVGAKPIRAKPRTRATPRPAGPTRRKAPANSSIRIAVVIAAPAWRARLPDAPARCRRWARAALAAAGFDLARWPGARGAELAILLTDDAALRRLNRDYRGQDKPTNVLAFPATDAATQSRAPRHREPRAMTPTIALGDVAIAYETMAYEARDQGKTGPAHLAHLVIHGVLHLLGYDHQSKAQAIEMEILETDLLARFGVKDPYRLRAPRAPRRPART